MIIKNNPKSIVKFLIGFSTAVVMTTITAQAQQVDAAFNVDNQFMVVVTDTTGIVNTGLNTNGTNYNLNQTKRFNFDVPLNQVKGQCLINIITWGDGAVAEGFAGVMKGNAGYVYTGGSGVNGIWNSVETSVAHNGSGPTSTAQVQSILNLNGPPPTPIQPVAAGGSIWGPITSYTSNDFGTAIPSDMKWVRPINGGLTTKNYWVFKSPCERVVKKVTPPPPPPPPPNSTEKGMTFGIRDTYPNQVNGVIHVGCGDKDGVNCDARNGDTLCTTPKPLLCINPMGLPKPANVNESRWDKWSGGIVGTTKPMPAPSKLSTANQACVAEFGNNWRVAQFHDVRAGRSGWAFSAYGNVGTQDKRFWTDIDDQPNGVCWNRSQ